MAPRLGLEINSDELGEVLENVVKPAIGKKYPLVLMMPPRSMGEFTNKYGEFEKYKIILFFLTTSYYDSGNTVRTMNTATRTSQHTIYQDWHDMKRCAVNFIRVLHQVMVDKKLANSVFRLEQSKRFIDPVSSVGVDRASGVKLEFNVSLFLNCTMEDYSAGDIAAITIPVEDSHPEHNL